MEFPICETYGNSENVVIALIAGVHGNERANIRAMNEMRPRIEDYFRESQQGIKLLLANPRAIEQSTRFIDDDLNRILGTDGDTYEHKVLEKLSEELRDIPIVVDFHNTSFDMRPYSVITQFNTTVDEILRYIGVGNCVLVDFDAIIGFPATGIALETGEATSQRAQAYAEMMIERLCEYVLDEQSQSGIRTEVTYFREVGQLDKDRLSGTEDFLTDFEQVKEGDTIGYDQRGGHISADEDFYPVWVDHEEAVNQFRVIEDVERLQTRNSGSEY